MKAVSEEQAWKIHMQSIELARKARENGKLELAKWFMSLVKLEIKNGS